MNEFMVKKLLFEKSAVIQKMILTRRQVYMGLAILMVIAYHASGRYKLSVPLIGRGYSGVDIFLFFSAVGLCFSYTNNSLSQFYKNRFIRIFPLFILLAIVRSIFFHINETQLEIWDYFCNLTTLSYYGLGGCFVDWYLSALLLLYLLFPILFNNVISSGGYFICCIISVLITTFLPIHWQYDCLVSRLPIFILGILFYKNIANTNFFIKYSLISLMLAVILFTVAYFQRLTLSVFISISFLIPFFICIFSILIAQKWMRWLNNILGWIGRYTLEIYVANCIADNIEKAFSIMQTVWIDLLLTALLSIVLYQINSKCTLLFKKSKKVYSIS